MMATLDTYILIAQHITIAAHALFALVIGSQFPPKNKIVTTLWGVAFLSFLALSFLFNSPSNTNERIFSSIALVTTGTSLVSIPTSLVFLIRSIKRKCAHDLFIALSTALWSISALIYIALIASGA